ncbi:site-2 protease family protein [Cellvibrio polysaccharolyticus]|uniref:Site-2 protease family protein n=1 Tax=Cellvibrio polysaccharolyticus TaxID=2082724 RepID=A0A928V4D8_9GAMM|nr:site-2 protease family protein [Cellvibrio polysaccharolyticus]MBE8716676.1 site-2 protease family protein [Cellvibrio polysaccharolyticus]
MQLLSFEWNSHQIQLNGSSWSGEEILLVDGQEVSRLRNFGTSNEHRFVLEGHGELILRFNMSLTRGEVRYVLMSGDTLLAEGEQTIALAASPLAAGNAPEVAPVASAGNGHSVNKGQWWLWLGAGLKLLKTAKVFKGALAVASVSVYSVMFTFEFAIALIAILVFHEYGHLRAMKKFGIPTKGMYLIPFVGGLAVGDKPNTRWQDVYISMMGPVYGLIMTLVFYVAWLITDSHFAGLVASTSALINAFNLLPMYPLDGGRVIKSLVFSGRRKIALVFLLTLSALFFVLSWKLGFALIGFFIILGVIDIVAEWRVSMNEDITPLNLYGILFCLGWYLLTLAAFLGIIVLIANSGLPGSEIALKVLNS